ncbi:hypothetical protein [Fuchsiella alkaliacetigena]|uniref:hypothetical protein n=1 Tax=Fuchsiella alkaliacetigena TaxID=957042 RepID=UPI00200AB488|nr:hypothetical protein [Fuchsiella alkaliacetigena]MCK8825418.1 hypothetical protein [Fuchsiella alkaliacetigena]
MSKKEVLVLLGLFLLGFLFLTNPLQIVEAGRENEVQQAEDKLIAARDLLYNNGGQTNVLARIENKLTTSQEVFSALDEGADKYRLLAKLEYLMIGYEQLQGGEDLDERLENRVRKTKELIEKSLEYDNQSSEAHWILGDIYIALTDYVGTFRQLRYAWRGVEHLEKAIELDSQNYDAYESLGSYYLLAPRIVGGDQEKGIELLEKAVVSDDDFINYQANVSLVSFYEEQGQLDKAVKHVQKSLEAYPRNNNMQNKLEELEEQLD